MRGSCWVPLGGTSLSQGGSLAEGLCSCTRANGVCQDRQVWGRRMQTGVGGLACASAGTLHPEIFENFTGNEYYGKVMRRFHDFYTQINPYFIPRTFRNTQADGGSAGSRGCGVTTP